MVAQHCQCTRQPGCTLANAQTLHLVCELYLKTCVFLKIEHSTGALTLTCAFLFFKDLIYLFLEKRKGREKDRKRHIGVQEKHGLVASHMYPDRGGGVGDPHPQPRHVP